MQQLAARLATSAVLIAVSCWALFIGPLWAFALILTAFIALALHEFFAMARHRGIAIHYWLSIALGAAFTALVAWRSLVEPGLMHTPVLEGRSALLSWTWDIFWPATIVLIFLRQLMRENTFEALSSLATTLFGLAYIAGLLSYLFYIRALNDHHGAWLVLYLVLVTKMGDAGAFALGKLLGRHTLVARISPRKTIEGSLGGVLVSAATGAFAQSLVPQLQGSLLTGACVGLVLGTAGQVGDLAESLIKRDCQVKDSGRLPGLGGVLDVLDSIIFTAPLFYAFLIYR